MLIDEKGQVADGDQIMGLIAQKWASEGHFCLLYTSDAADE